MTGKCHGDGWCPGVNGRASLPSAWCEMTGKNFAVTFEDPVLENMEGCQVYIQTNETSTVPPALTRLERSIARAMLWGCHDRGINMQYREKTCADLEIS